MKIMTVFIDVSAWVAITDAADANHSVATEYFKELLEKNTKMICNNAVIDQALQEIKKRLGNDKAKQFLNIIDESVLTINLRMDWLARRVRRNALARYLKDDKDLELIHYYIFETIDRKKVDIIFSFDQRLARFGLPIMPNTGKVHE